jgi:hypothetical protein
LFVLFVITPEDLCLNAGLFLLSCEAQPYIPMFYYLAKTYPVVAAEDIMLAARLPAAIPPAPKPTAAIAIGAVTMAIAPPVTARQAYRNMLQRC